MATPDGFTVVLTADATLMAGYCLLFDGMLAASQTTTTPWPVVRALLVPRAGSAGLRSKVAPLGLRRVEAALLRSGFGPEEVAIVAPHHLGRAIGPATRVVGVSAGEPLGRGMSTTTMQAIAGGRAHPSAKFASLMKTIRRAVRAAGGRAAVTVGGPGAWQLACGPQERTRLGIDHVVTGYAEGNVAEVYGALIEEEDVPEHIAGEGVSASEIPPIAGASTMGVIEISRGCGLGCSFCTMAHIPMQHLPEDTIIADARTNVAAGVRHVCAISEDLFRYGSRGLATAPEALISLLSRLREIDGLGLIQTDHGNVYSVSQYTDDELAQVRGLLVGASGQEYPWVNVGIETASGALLRANGGATKMGGCPNDEWADFCSTQLRRLSCAGLFPMASIVVGLPGTTEDDTQRTLRWVQSLSSRRLAVFPVLFAPIDGRPVPAPGDLRRSQWRLIKACYALNARWIPRMYWDNQRAAGVGVARRCLMQLLGRAQVWWWRALFAWRGRRATR